MANTQRNREWRLRGLWRRSKTFATVSESNFGRANRWVFWTCVAHLLPFVVLAVFGMFLVDDLSFKKLVSRGMVAALALGLIVTAFSQAAQARRQSSILAAASLLLVAVASIMVALPDLTKGLNKSLPETAYMEGSLVCYALAFIVAYGGQLLRLQFADDVEDLDFEQQASERVKKLTDEYDKPQ
jgi:hypothetical protein